MKRPPSNRRKPKRELAELRSIGPAMLRDLDRLGIHTLSPLANSNALALYQKLCRLSGQRQDPCVLDTFTPPCLAALRQGRICGIVPPSAKDSWEGRHTCAVEQAKNPGLPSEQKNWGYWSRIRKTKIGRSKARI